MKVTAKLSPVITIDIDGETQVDIFEKLSAVQEVFGITKCGKCGSQDLRYITREDKEENKYHEIQCQNPKCRAKLAFGQNKKGGGLFPRRKDSEGKYIDNGGWSVYVKPAT